MNCKKFNTLIYELVYMLFKFLNNVNLLNINNRSKNSEFKTFDKFTTRSF